MAKQKFTIAHDLRFDGKHVPAGSVIELDATDNRDAATLHNLLSSNRVVEVEAAHKHLTESAEAARVKREPAKITAPESKPKPEAKP